MITKGARANIEAAASYVRAAVAALEEAQQLLGHVRYASGAVDSAAVVVDRCHRFHNQVRALTFRRDLALDSEPQR